MCRLFVVSTRRVFCRSYCLWEEDLTTFVALADTSQGIDSVEDLDVNCWNYILGQSRFDIT